VFLTVEVRMEDQSMIFRCPDRENLPKAVTRSDFKYRFDLTAKPTGIATLPPHAFVLWPAVYIFVFWSRSPEPKMATNGYYNKISRFEQAKVEEITMPNMISTLPGFGLVTERSPLI
jgi:hypothetical protein